MASCIPNSMLIRYSNTLCASPLPRYTWFRLLHTKTSHNKKTSSIPSTNSLSSTPTNKGDTEKINTGKSEDTIKKDEMNSLHTLSVATKIADNISDINNDASLKLKISKMGDNLSKINKKIDKQINSQAHPLFKKNNNNDSNGTIDTAKTTPVSKSIRHIDILEGQKIQLESFFDSYKVVKKFKESGFSDEEAKLLMKYTYLKLEQKFNWLDQNYSPKVDLENETYLFEAAHSELLFEVTNSREISLMNLTNAMIILKRGFNNLEDETSAQIKLNDDSIKMEINQFKHENNLHQKSLNLKNSDLNSRILSDMVSVLKSEIETFRWQLTRAGISAIVLMVVFILGGWQVTKKLSVDDSDDELRGPLLIPVHEQTDEESHDYEADWDERVRI